MLRDRGDTRTIEEVVETEAPRITEDDRNYIRSLEDRHGELTTERVIEDAKRKASPLHRFFLWSKEEGWKVYMKETARRLIRSVRVEMRTVSQTYTVPDYVPSVRSEGYVNVERVRAAADKSVLIERELRAALGHCKRVAGLAAKVKHPWFEAIDQGCQLFANLLGDDAVPSGAAAKAPSKAKKPAKKHQSRKSAVA